MVDDSKEPNSFWFGTKKDRENSKKVLSEMRPKYSRFGGGAKDMTNPTQDKNSQLNPVKTRAKMDNMAAKHGRAGSKDGFAMARKTFGGKTGPSQGSAVAGTPKKSPPGNFKQGEDVAAPPMPRQKPAQKATGASTAAKPKKIERAAKVTKKAASGFKGNWRGAAPSKDGIAGKKGSARLKALAKRAQEEN